MQPKQDRDGATLRSLLQEIDRCRICRDAPHDRPLPHEPRPVLRVSPNARLCIAGQAPGTRVHASGVPFTDPSGDRLRQWLNVDRSTFYDETRVAIVPMGFCFPGLDRHGSDLPPRRECAANWHARVFEQMPRLRLILAIGAYAQAYHLGTTARAGVTKTVQNWRTFMSKTADGVNVIPLPHPSWRNSGWLKRNPWFEAELLPVLRKAVDEAIGPEGSNSGSSIQ